MEEEHLMRLRSLLHASRIASSLHQVLGHGRALVPAISLVVGMGILRRLLLGNAVMLWGPFPKEERTPKLHTQFSPALPLKRSAP